MTAGHAMTVPNSPPVRVFVIAAPLLRWGLQQVLLASGGRCECAGAAPLAREALPLVARHPAERVSEGELWLDRSAAGRLFLHMVRRRTQQQHDELARPSSVHPNGQGGLRV